jgi:hypothetical protein
MGQRETAKQIWDILITDGWSQQAVAAVLGNMQTESGIIADRWESDLVGNLSGGYGLVQWTPASKYIDWANANNLSYQTVSAQCQRLLWEVQNNQQFYHPNMSFYEFTRSHETPETLADIFIRYYERPANPDQPARQTQARYWFDQFSVNNPDRITAAIRNMISWMEVREGKVTYSMTNRYGPSSYDCSSAVYYALMAGGFLASGTNIGNTDTLFGDLERNQWSKLPVVNGQYNVKKGDIFIWGIRGASSGAVGHTGIFIDSSDNIIHCNYGYNGITVNNYDIIWNANGQPPATIYRYTGNETPTPNPNPGGNTGLIPYTGVFIPNIQLPVSGDTEPNSPALAYYDPGMSILYDSYIFANGYAWISYISYSGPRRYVAVGPDDGRTDTVWGTGFLNNVPGGGGDGGGLHPCYGVFYPTIQLPVSGDTDPNSPAIAYYGPGEAIIYDSYIFSNGYVWISYISGSGLRRYIAVGPDDGRTDTVWGTGFLDNYPGNSQDGPHVGTLIPKSGIFYPNIQLPISGDTDPDSPALGYYDSGDSIIYDSYCFINGYAWISYIATSGYRRFIAIGPDDGRTDTVWGTGFFN